MNIPTIDDTTESLFNLDYFSHDKEMENFANHVYLEYKGARTGVIGGDDPFEDTIIGISPKVFTLLMLARLNLCFRPVPSNPLVGIMIAVPVSFGELTVYSATPDCWTKPTRGTQHLGFTMMYNKVPKTLAYLLEGSSDGLHIIPEDSAEQLVLGSTFNIDEETYLNDLCDEMHALLTRFSNIHDELMSAIRP